MKFTYNPSEEKFLQNPHVTYDYMRENCPIYISSNGFVILTRYDDVASTLRNPKMSVQYTDYAEGSAAKYLDPIKKLQQSNPLIGNWRTMLRVDDPLHDRIKKFSMPLFSNANIIKMSNDIETIVKNAVRGVANKDRVDLVSEIALKIAQDTICYLIDVPEKDKEQIFEWADALTMVFEPIQSSTEGVENVGKLLPEVFMYLHNLIQDRIKNPKTNDIITSLLNNEIDGYKLEYPEVIGTIAMMFFAGIETATYFMSNSIYTLLSVPSAQDQLLNIFKEIDDSHDDVYHSSLLNNAIEELIRYNGSVWQTSRVNLEDTNYSFNNEDITIPKGSMITVSIASANRDPKVFDSPHVLNLKRENAKKNIGFSAGAHYCLGANLAKLQSSALFLTLFKNYPQLKLLENPIWKNRLTFRGVKELFVSFN